MKRVLFALAFLALSSTVQAQGITKWTIRSGGDTTACVASAALASIVVLDEACYPAAVVRRVRAIVVDSVNCQSSRTFAHVFQKGCEIIPSGAYVNTSSAVVGVTLARGPIASVAHPCPDAKFTAVTSAVSASAGTRQGSLKTAATLSGA